jgi:hypothetical protein
MEVVHMRGQGLCVCFQHAPSVSAGKAAAVDVAGISTSSVSYSVFVLHHGCTLVYTIPLPDVPASGLQVSGRVRG